MTLLNDTLDAMLIKVSNMNHSAPNDITLKEVFISNLKEFSKVNSHGLWEIKIPLDNLVMKGTAEFVKKLENIYTEFALI